MAVMASCATAL